MFVKRSSFASTFAKTFFFSFSLDVVPSALKTIEPSDGPGKLGALDFALFQAFAFLAWIDKRLAVPCIILFASYYYMTDNGY